MFGVAYTGPTFSLTDSINFGSSTLLNLILLVYFWMRNIPNMTILGSCWLAPVRETAVFFIQLVLWTRFSVMVLCWLLAVVILQFIFAMARTKNLLSHAQNQNRFCSAW